MIFFPDKIPEQIFGLSGRVFYALAHTFLVYVLGLFTMVHIYLGTTGSTPLELYRGILTGWVPAHEDTPNGHPQGLDNRPGPGITSTGES